MPTGSFTETLSSRGPELCGMIVSELGRQRDGIKLIACAAAVRAEVVKDRKKFLIYPGL